MIEKGSIMKSEIDLIPVVVTTPLRDFKDFDTGQGYVDTIGDVRFKTDSEYYIHINSGSVEINEKINWPLLEEVEVRTFKLIVKEI